MCIEQTVGKSGRNLKADVIIVQTLLNFNLTRLALKGPIDVNGTCGSSTKAAILAFQTRVLGFAKPDGNVDPIGRTLAALQDSVPDTVPDGTRLRAIMPTAKTSQITLYAAPLWTGMQARAINTPLRQAHFLAQLGHESGAFSYSEELASGSAYEGRVDLGNTQSGDGRRFKGRGLIQLTGRSNYTAYGQAIAEDLTSGDNAKRVAAEPRLATDVACWFWETRSLNALADLDDVLGITRAINGGYNGLADRRAYLRRAKFFFGLDWTIDR